MKPKDTAVGGRFWNNKEGWRPVGQRYLAVDAHFSTIFGNGAGEDEKNSTKKTRGSTPFCKSVSLANHVIVEILSEC